MVSTEATVAASTYSRGNKKQMIASPNLLFCQHTWIQEAKTLPGLVHYLELDLSLKNTG